MFAAANIWKLKWTELIGVAGAAGRFVAGVTIGDAGIAAGLAVGADLAANFFGNGYFGRGYFFGRD